MGLDRLAADTKLLSNFAGRKSVAKQSNYFKFPVAEFFQERARRRFLRNKSPQ
jgi:hypothetical protein